MRKFVTMLGIGGLIIISAGCAALTAGDRDMSDQPWNQPQPWEGSPHIPGLGRY